MHSEGPPLGRRLFPGGLILMRIWRWELHSIIYIYNHLYIYTVIQSLTITFWWFWAVSLAVAVQVAGNGTSSANLPVAATGSDRHTINEKNRRTHQEPRANGLSNFNFSLALPALLRWGPMAKQLFLSLHTSQQLCYLLFFFLRVFTSSHSHFILFVAMTNFTVWKHIAAAQCVTSECSSWLMGSLSSANAWFW